MAQNDMFVVMYKIIAYLYDCMRRGIDPQQGEYSADALGIPERYWRDVMRELSRNHFIIGVTLMPHGFDDVTVKLDRPRVTMQGVQFASENSMMGKARLFLREAKSSIPFI